MYSCVPIYCFISCNCFPYKSSKHPKLRVRIGSNASVIADMIGFCLLTISGFVSSYSKTKALMPSLVYIFYTTAFVLVLYIGIKPLMNLIVRWTPVGPQVIVMALACGIMTKKDKQLIFIFGLATSDGPLLGSAIVEKLECPLSSIFVPLFMTTTALKVDLKSLNCNKVGMKYAIVIILVCFLVKIIACMIPFLQQKMSILLLLLSLCQPKALLT